MENPVINKWGNGNIRWIEYFNNEKDNHREDGPAFQYFFENGNIKIEKWYINGKRHKTDGPAQIYYYKNGYIVEEYFIDGEELTKQQFIVHSRKRKLGKINETDNN